MRGLAAATPDRLRRAAIVLVAVLGAACAGTPEVKLPGPESTTPPLPRAEYTARANEICRATTKAIVERTEATGSGRLDAGSGGDRAELREVVDPIVRLALTRLRNLTPPPEDRAVAQQALDALQTAADAAGSDPQAPLDPVGLNRPDLFDFGLTGCFASR